MTAVVDGGLKTMDAAGLRTTRAISGRGVATLWALVRGPEWIKNTFVFAPLIFSGRLLETDVAGTVLLIFVGLCAVSSSLYIVNDLLDRTADQEHPAKRMRPLAAGMISPAGAAVIALGLLAVGAAVLMAAPIPASALSLTAAFALLNLTYSTYLKRKVIVDVLAIASGYVLRVLIGGAVIGVAVTHWLVLCTFLLATFLGFSKRRHELAVLGSAARRHRPVLTLYSEEFLDRASLLALAMTLTCYVLYTISPETIARLGTDALVYSGLIVMFALFRYLFLIHVKHLGSPVEVVYYDRQIVLAVAAWVLYVVGLLYTWPSLAAVIR